MLCVCVGDVMDIVFSVCILDAPMHCSILLHHINICFQLCIRLWQISQPFP